MSNTFKAGDKITLTPRNEPLAQLLTSLIAQHTKETEFTLDTVGLATHNSLEEHLNQPSPEPDAVSFKLPCGKVIEFSYEDITLVS